MPDFPQIGGATAAQIWAYATRRLSDATNITSDGATINQALIANLDAAISTRSSHSAADIWGVATRRLSDAQNITSDGATIDQTKIAKLDATISSRSSHAAADVWAVAARTVTAATNITSDGGTIDQTKVAHLDADISTRSSHAAADVWTVAARQLTAITGTPRSDLLGEDATFEAGTGARKARIDKTPAFETHVETSVVMDGTEKTLVEKADDKMGLLDGYVDLTPMQAGDTIVIRQYMKVKAAGAYVKYAEETYTGAQTIPLLHVVTKTAKTSIKVTAEQTAGTNRTLDVQFFRRVEA